MWVWEAYAEFSASRVWSMGQPYPIALTEIMAYSTLKGYSRDETEELLQFMRLLDDVYFKHVTEKAKRDGRSTRSRS